MDKVTKQLSVPLRDLCQQYRDLKKLLPPFHWTLVQLTLKHREERGEKVRIDIG